MTLSRRRFMAISAGLALAPSTAAATSWSGRAFGADVAITIRGGAQAQQALDDALGVIRRVERLFSLYDPASDLVQLNKTGTLEHPDVWFGEMMLAADQAWQVTNGLFDPTVQALWLAHGTTQVDHVGWEGVQFDATTIKLGRDQALTFNGIAQGFATDKVTEVLIAHGLGDVLVNIGEHRGVGGPWRLGLDDPKHGRLGHRTFRTGAIATSSPMATRGDSGGHILHPTRVPEWSTVCVEAASATAADCLSTAMVLATREEIDEIRSRIDLSRVTLVSRGGDLITL